MVLKLRIGKRRITISQFAVIFILSLLLAISIFIYSYMRYYGTPYFYTLVFLGVLSFILPVGGYIYYQYLRLQAKEYYFPQFLKDLADGARAGLALPQAVLNVSKINYGPLTEDVRRLATYISWGVPFDEALRRFSKKIKSKMIRTSVDLIIEAYLAGGDVADILETMSEDAAKIHTLREERKTKFSGFVSTLYAVYIIFLLIVVILINVLIPEIPTMPSFGGASLLGGTISARATVPEDELRAIFFHLAMIEAIFAGILAGVAGEGSVVAGIKHAIILIFIGIAVFQIFIAVPDPVDRIARALTKIPPNVEASVNVGRFYVEESFTVGDVLQRARDYVRSIGLPVEGGKERVVFVEDPSCEACEKGYVIVRPDAVIVKTPTYVSITVQTKSDEGVYYVRIS